MPKDVDTAKRNAYILERNAAGASERTIAKEVGLAKTTVHDIIQEYYYSTVLPVADDARKAQVERLEIYRQKALEILEKNHVVVQHGKVVQYKDPITGELSPLEDDAVTLAAIDRVLKIEESISKLIGTAAPTKVEATVTEVTQADLELEEIMREAKARQLLEEKQVAGGQPHVAAQDQRS